MGSAAKILIILVGTFLLTSCGSSSGSPSGRGASINGPTSLLKSDSNDDSVSKIIWQEEDRESPEEIQAEALAPRHYGFMLPVRSIPLATYFYGPRVMSSWDKSQKMVAGDTKLPVVLIHAWQHPLQHLLERHGKYSFEFHGGIDLVAKIGTPIFATNDGTIFIAGLQDCVGETVVIRHEIIESHHIVYSVYNHLQAGSYKNLKAGDKIAKGVQFAQSGDTGSKNCIEGGHLHFEMRTPNPGTSDVAPDAASSWANFLKDTARVNPADYIKEVDDACQKRKNMEIINANLVQKNEPGALAPLSAGRCGLKYESHLGVIPPIYSVNKPEDLRQTGLP